MRCRCRQITAGWEQAPMMSCPPCHKITVIASTRLVFKDRAIKGQRTELPISLLLHLRLHIKYTNIHIKTSNRHKNKHAHRCRERRGEQGRSQTCVQVRSSRRRTSGNSHQRGKKVRKHAWVHELSRWVHKKAHRGLECAWVEREGGNSKACAMSMEARRPSI